MRPVNLIPAEDRVGERIPARTGGLAYVVVGALLTVLGAVMLLVLTQNQISDSKAKVSRLEVQQVAVQAQADRLAGYAQFRSVRDERVATVSSLADSRFDWERVMRELSLVLPKDVWLTNLTGTVNPEVEVDGGANVALRDSVPGPALEIVGCAPGQASVARFISALKQIDGVTRVGVQSSELPTTDITASAGGAVGATGGSDGGDCRTRNFIAQFQIVAAFDAAPVPVGTIDPITGAPVTTTVGAATAATDAATATSTTSTAVPSTGATATPTSTPAPAAGG